MPDTLAPLIDDLLEWIGQGRPYREVMDAWRTSCPRLPVWEEANLRGYVHCRRDAAGVEHVLLTACGAGRLQQLRTAFTVIPAKAGIQGIGKRAGGALPGSPGFPPPRE